MSRRKKISEKEVCDGDGYILLDNLEVELYEC